jgi:intein/homing endonuclease
MEELVDRHLTGEVFYVNTSQDEFGRVIEAGLTHKNAEILSLGFEENGVLYNIKCTPDHKIMTKNRGWVEAKDLTEDDDVVVR